MEVHNALFQDCLSKIPEDQKKEFDLLFDIGSRIDFILKKKGMTRHELAVRMKKRDSEVCKWLTGRHNFTLTTISGIEYATGEKIIDVRKP